MTHIAITTLFHPHRYRCAHSTFKHNKKRLHGANHMTHHRRTAPSLILPPTPHFLSTPLPCTTVPFMVRRPYSTHTRSQPPSCPLYHHINTARANSHLGQTYIVSKAYAESLPPLKTAMHTLGALTQDLDTVYPTALPGSVNLLLMEHKKAIAYFLYALSQTSHTITAPNMQYAFSHMTLLDTVAQKAQAPSYIMQHIDRLYDTFLGQGGLALLDQKEAQQRLMQRTSPNMDTPLPEIRPCFFSQTIT